MEIKDEVTAAKVGLERVGSLWLRYRLADYTEVISILDGPPGIGYSLTVPKQDLRDLALRLMDLADQLGAQAN